MGRRHIGHADLAAFTRARVNLPAAKAAAGRAQAGRLGERLAHHLAAHPDFGLKRLMLSGSLAKGTALWALNDIDMACYIGGAETPGATDVAGDGAALPGYLAERLRRAFPNVGADQVQPKTYSVTVSFRGSGLDVDVVPVLYRGDPDWYGDLVSQEDGSLLATCIPRHVAFIRRRGADFAQVARLIKAWIGEVKRARPDFRFKSFMAELILAHLADRGFDLADHVDALRGFFAYVARTNMREPIVFTDYYKTSAVGFRAEPVRIIDPVNPRNNVGLRYSPMQADAIVAAAREAGEAIDAARAAAAKREAVRQWRLVFGPGFAP